MDGGYKCEDYPSQVNRLIFAAYLSKDCPENKDNKEAKESQGRSHKKNKSLTKDKMEATTCSVDFSPPFSTISI